MHRFTKGLACCSHAKETKVQQACQHFGMPSFTPRSPHLHPGGRHGGLRMSALREQLGGHGTERGAPGKTGEASPPWPWVVGSCLFHFPSIHIHSIHDITASFPTCALLRQWLFAFCILLDEISLCQVYSFGIVLLELLTASPPATKREATCHWVKVVDDLWDWHVRLLTCSAVQRCLEQLLSF